MTKKYILVTGGAGFIGSHIVKILEQTGYYPISFDNLSHGNRKSVTCGTFVEGDLNSSKNLNELFANFKIDAVMHFAAFIDVGESVSNPAIYYINNVTNTLNLLEAMRQHGVNKFIFSSSASIFGIPKYIPIDEAHPCVPINPYGETKLFIERVLMDYDKAYDIKSICLRYFNAAGGDPEGKIKNYKIKETNLIPLILRSLQKPERQITIYGTDYETSDGTCIRDYIHIDDLGRAHILAMEQLFEGASSTAYNLGNGNGFSVKQVIKAVEKVTGLHVNAIEGPRRAGDPAILIADSKKAFNELGWVPKYNDLTSIIAHAWQAHQ